MDLADIFRKGLQDLHKDVFDKNYKKRSLLSRKESFINARRQTRDTLRLNRRPIPANLSPYITPKSNEKEMPADSEVLKPKNEEPNKTNKRYEMLKQWQDKRNKQKEAAKKHAKPIFKVCHVDRNIGLPNLENVNKQIKGKPITTPTVKSFAPLNHKFKPPPNIKPIQIVKPISRNAQQTKNRLVKPPLQKNPAKSQPKVGVQNVENKNDVRMGQSHVRPKTADSHVNNISTNNMSKNATNLNNTDSSKMSGSSKNEKVVHMRVQKIGNSSIHKASSGVKYGKTIQSKSKVISGKKSPNVENSTKKNKETCKTTNKNYTTPKINKPLKATPTFGINNNLVSKQNKKKLDCINIDDNDDSEIEKVVIYDDEEITLKTPVKKSRKSRLSSIKKSAKITRKVVQDSEQLFVKVDKQNLSTEKVIIYDDEEITLKTPVKKSRKSRLSSIKKSAKITRKIVQDSEQLPVKEDKENLSIEKVIIYDEEITLKTPIKKSQKSHLPSAKASKNSTRKCVEENEYSIVTPKLEDKKSLKYDEEYSSTDIEKNVIKTPRKSINSTPVYISPFVTISRGKDSARKEFNKRKSTGGTLLTSPEGKDFSQSTSPQAGAAYFENILDSQISRIEAICEIWNCYKQENNLSEEAIAMIDVTIGQSKLLLTKKFEQFRSLIRECKSAEFKNKPITCEDLHGFWDMIYQQVINLDKRFDNLEAMKNNNWEEEIPEKKIVQTRKRGRPKKKTASSSSSIREMIKAARNKRKNNEDLNVQLLEPKTPEFSKILSPVRTSSARRSLRVSLLRGQSVKRLSSPGLTMMKITQSIKAGDGLTPSKSILKTDVTKSAKRHNKSVLFVDDVEDTARDLDIGIENKENCATEANIKITKEVQNKNNLTPVRRSKRISKLT